MSTTASIAAKGTNGTGITEDLAKRLHDQLGKTIVVIAEIRSESRGENLKGDETVKLAIRHLEVIPDDMGAAEHVREIAKVAHYNRKLAADGPTLPLDGDRTEPTVEAVVAAGAQHRPHPYLASTLSTDDSEAGPVCDVCGLLTTAPIHSEQSTLPDPFAIPEPSDQDQDQDGEQGQDGHDLEHDHEDEADCGEDCPAYVEPEAGGDPADATEEAWEYAQGEPVST